MLKIPFLPKQLYNRRRDIHAVYGGNWQSGICPSSNYPYIFIFTVSTGHHHGYEDGWDNPNIFTWLNDSSSSDTVLGSLS